VELMERASDSVGNALENGDISEEDQMVVLMGLLSRTSTISPKKVFFTQTLTRGTYW